MATTNLQVRITADPTSFMQAMGQVNGALSKADAQARKTSSGFAALGSSLTSVGAGLTLAITAPIVAVGIASIKASAEIDTLRRALTTTAGGAEEAGKQFARLKEIAKLPGIDLPEAVRGSIRLQNYGISAALAEKALRGVSNAVAGAGGSAEDTGEALRQMGQIWGRQKVTMDNLRIVLERVPQSAAIIRKEFGAEALADPAKALEKLGINAEKFLTILIERLAAAPKTTAGLKTSLENLSQEVTIAASRIGDALTPSLLALIPKLESVAKKVADLAAAFGKLPESTQTITLGLVAVAAALPVVITGLGVFLTNLTAVKVAMASMGLALTAAGAAIATFGAGAVTIIASMAGVAVGTAAATTAVGIFSALTLVAAGSIAYLTNAMYELWKAESKAADAAKMESGALEILLDRVKKAHPEVGALEVRYRAGQISAADFSAELLRLARTMKSTTIPAKETKDAITGVGEALKETNKIIVDSVGESKFDKLNRLFADGKVSIEAYKQEHEKLSKVLADGNMEGNKFSTTSLVYVESLERIKAAVGKVKDAMFDYFRQGTLGGKTMETWRAPIDQLAFDYGKLGEAMQTVLNFQQVMGNIRPPQIEITNQDTFRKGSPFEADDILGRSGSSSTRQQSSRVTQAEADLARIKELNREGKATGNDVITAQQNLKKAIEDVGKAGTKSGKAQSQALQQVSLVINDLARGITDIIFKGGKIGDMLKNVAMQGAQSITRLLIEGALSKLASKILDVGGLFGKVFGGGTGAIMSAAPGAAGGIAGAAGGAGGAASSAAGAAGAGVSGIFGMVTGAISAASGVWSNFQNIQMEKTMNAIEKEVRFSQIHLLGILEKANATWPYLHAIHERLFEIRQVGVKLEGAGAGGVTVNMAGAYLLSDGTMADFAQLLAREFKKQGL